MKRLGTFTAALLLTSALTPVYAQQPVTVIGTVTPGNCVQWFSTTQLKDPGITCNGGATTSPGGSNGQVQYNNAGTFGGLTNAQLAALLPLRIRLTADQTFYVNGNSGSTATCGVHGTSSPLTCSAGSDSNNCLTPGTACLTSNHVFSLILENYDSAGFNIIVNGAHCASAGCGVNLAFACVGSPIGATTLSFSGDYDNPTAVEIFAPNGGDAISANDQCTVSIDSIAVADQGSAVHGFYVPKLAQLDVRSVTITGTWNTGACIFCAGGADAILNVLGVGNGGITNTLATTSTGQVFQAASGGQINFAGQTVAIPSAITVGAGQAFGFNLGGSIIGISSGTFTGSGVAGTTGLRCLSFDSFWGNVDPNTVFPGNTNCAMHRTYNSARPSWVRPLAAVQPRCSRARIQ